MWSFLAVATEILTSSPLFASSTVLSEKISALAASRDGASRSACGSSGGSGGGGGGGGGGSGGSGDRSGDDEAKGEDPRQREEGAGEADDGGEVTEQQRARKRLHQNAGVLVLTVRLLGPPTELELSQLAAESRICSAAALAVSRLSKERESSAGKQGRLLAFLSREGAGSAAPRAEAIPLLSALERELLHWVPSARTTAEGLRMLPELSS